MTLSPPTSIRIRLPQEWLQLDPRADDLLGELRRVLDDRWRDWVEEDQLLSLLTPLAIELRRLADQTEIVLCGLYADVLTAEDAAQPLVLTAHCMLSVSPPVGSLDELRQALLAGSELETVPVTLPAGLALRQSGTITVGHPDWDTTVSAYRRWFFIELPGTDQLATLTFLTPNVSFSSTFDEVFDAIAGTLVFGWDG